MLARLPERVRTPAVARAATSPSALLLAGAAMSAAIVGGVPIAAAAVVGAVAWVARVALAVPRARAGDRVNANNLHEPWRRFVVDAQQAKARFDRTVRQTQDGPLKERLAMIGGRIADGVTECWRIARQGDVLQHALKTLDADVVERELAAVSAELRQASGSRRDTLTRTRDALVAQQQSYTRLASVWDDARNRLELLNAQLDEAVARAVELSVHSGELDALNPLTADVESLVDELESLRLGLEEAGGAASEATAS
jgi:chromosome condensin MukBEF ATPase and DNA-binding subunit MukB